MKAFKLAKWLNVGILIFVAGAILELSLVVVAVARIESPTSWTWATLTFVAMLLLASGLLTVYTSRQRK